MILRRVIGHFRKQEWTAIALDFLIVVVGVFVGLQVQDWSEARKDRIEEHALLVRLHVDTRTLLALNIEDYKAQKVRGDSLLSVNPVLFSQEPARPLTVKECEGIAGSHVYRLGSDELPVLDEMLETGRFNLLSSEAVKSQLRNYVLFRERERRTHAERTNELFRLHSRYPQLIAITRAPIEEGYEGRWTFLSGEGFRWVLNCDVGKMRENVAFLNEYVDNIARQNSSIQGYEQRKKLLTALEAALAAELGVEPMENHDDH